MDRTFLVTIGLGKEAYEVLDVRYEPCVATSVDGIGRTAKVDATYFLVYLKSGFTWVDANKCKHWRYG